MWAKYTRSTVVEIRPYILGEDLTHIRVNSFDNPRRGMGMVARNIHNTDDMWYMSREYFETNFKLKKD